MADSRRGRRGRGLIVGGMAFMLWAGPAAIASGPLVAGTATISVAPPTVRFGAPVTVAGSVDAEPPCVADRAVEIQSRPADAAGWVTAASTTTSEGGGFSASPTPSFTGSFRAVLPQTGRDGTTCAPVFSDEATVVVAAAVSATTGPAGIAAGTCRRVTVTVGPSKPGDTVQVQRQGAAGGWFAVATATLDPAGAARPSLCFGWGSIGRVTVRARWISQDALNATGLSDALNLTVVRAPWMGTIDRLTAGRAVSVSLREAGAYLYRRADTVLRTPASNEKLLLSMALLDRLDPSVTIATTAAAATAPDQAGVIDGDLWLLGHGDPEIEPADLAALAQRVKDAGVTAVQGSVIGSTGHFDRDWFAPGWKSYFPADVVALPSALSFRGNDIGGVHVTNPEFRAARSLTVQLRKIGVEVVGKPDAEPAPVGLAEVARIESAPIAELLEVMNVDSRNFHAEVLGKVLGIEASGVPGTITKGAGAIEAFAAAHAVTITAHDGSGLSYANRVTASGLVRLLGAAEAEPWGPVLKDSLPGPGEGTLEHRLAGVPVEAKTGSLIAISALSGYVYVQRSGAWAEFSILSRGMSKSTAVAMENAIVRTLWRYAR